MKKIKSMFFAALFIGVLCAGTVSARQLRSDVQGSTCGGTCSATKLAVAQRHCIRSAKNWVCENCRAVCREASLKDRRASGHLSHSLKQIGTCRGARSQRVQWECGGKMRRAALKADLQELAVIAFAE